MLFFAPLIPFAIGILGGLAKRMRRNRQLKQQAQETDNQLASANSQTTATSSISTAATSDPNTAQTAAGAANTGGGVAISGSDTNLLIRDRSNTGGMSHGELTSSTAAQDPGGFVPAPTQTATTGFQGRANAQLPPTGGGQQQQAGGVSAAAMGEASKAKSRKKNLAQQAALNARTGIQT